MSKSGLLDFSICTKLWCMLVCAKVNMLRFLDKGNTNTKSGGSLTSEKLSKWN